MFKKYTATKDVCKSYAFHLYYKKSIESVVVDHLNKGDSVKLILLIYL